MTTTTRPLLEVLDEHVRTVQLVREFGDLATVFTYSDGGTQVVLRDTNRPDLGTVIRYSDGSPETTVTVR